MEDMFYYVRKSSYAAGWISVLISFTASFLVIVSKAYGYQSIPASFLLLLGGVLGVDANVIGAAHNSKGQAYLGIAGVIFAFLVYFFSA